MTTIAFIGLGIMGSPMACNLAKAGHDVVGYNRTASKADALVAAGGKRATTIAEAVKGAEIIITMLPDSPDVEGVVAGHGGILENADPGAMLIDMSTIRPAVSRRLSALALDQGLRPLDAPVSGGEPAAVEGTLSIMVGGTATDFAAAEHVLKHIGTTIVHVGGAGAGQAVKAANQLIVAGTIELLSEALVLIDAQGVNLGSAVQVLAGGLAGSTVLNRKAASMLAGDFKPGFTVELHHKDLGIVMEAAREANVAVPLGSLVTVLMGALRSQGYGNLDHSALLRGVERMSGRE